MTTWILTDTTFTEGDQVQKVISSSNDYGTVYLAFLHYHDKLIQEGMKIQYPSIQEEHFNYQMGGDHRVEISSYRH